MDKRTLNLMGDAVERTLQARGALARVTGGSEGHRVIRFDLALHSRTRPQSVKALADDLALALRVPRARIAQDDGGLFLEVAHPSPSDVALLPLLAKKALPAGAALLGVQADGTPLLAKLASPDVAHILIAGTTGSGKSVLLRTIAASLILSNAPSALSIVVLDPKGRTFPANFQCPHLLRGKVITDNSEALEVLRSLVALMEARDKRRESTPTLAVIVDELADLVMSASAGVEQQLIRLAQRGREAGLHLIAATQRPSAAVISGLMRANFPLRLVGRTVTPEDSRIASGRGGVGADKLTGRGDFLAVCGGDARRFQAAYVSVDDLQRALPRDAGAAAVDLPTPDPLPEATPVMDDLDILTARLLPWWERNWQRWQAGEWGIQKKAIAVLFPGDPNATNAGCWRDALLKVVERLENSTTDFLPS